MRYERKYIFRDKNIFLITSNLYSLGFCKAFPPRLINSIYYDNLNNQIARDNLSGISKRCKLRIRYYGEKDTANCFLEIKKKLNKFGFKKVIDIQKDIN